MGEPAILVIFATLIAAAIAGLIYLTWQRTKQRREAFFRLAARLGLEFSIPDPFDTTSLPFALFEKGDRRDAENVMWGSIGDMRVRTFDYWYQVRHHNPNGPDTTSTYRFSCAMAEIDAECPHLTIDQEDFGSRLARHVGIHDIEFESEEFNKRFKIACDDRRFAFAFIDAAMMEWLLDAGGICTYEINGPLVLAYGDRVDPAEYETLIDVLRRFRGHVPSVVASLYPRTNEARA